MNHVDIVLDSDLDYLVNGEVRLNGRILSALSNLVGFVRLCKHQKISEPEATLGLGGGNNAL